MNRLRTLAFGILLSGALCSAHSATDEAATDFAGLVKIIDEPDSGDQAVAMAIHGIRNLLDKGRVAAADRETVRALARKHIASQQRRTVVFTTFMLCAALREPEFTNLLKRIVAEPAILPAVAGDGVWMVQAVRTAAMALRLYEFAAIPPGSVPAIAAAGRTAPFNVAIAIRNEQGGMLEPIGRFDGTQWVNTWPEMADNDEPVPELDELPDQWLGGKPARAWGVLGADGQRIAVQVEGTGRRQECSGIPSLKLTTASAQRLTRYEPLIAVDTQQEVGAVRALGKVNWDWSTMEGAVRSHFVLNQASLLDGLSSLYGYWPTEAELEGQPIVLEFLVRRAADPDSTTYYFEASRTTSGQPDSEVVLSGPVKLVISGWLVKVATDRWSAVGLRVHVKRGFESAPVPSTVPMGTITVNGRMFWLNETRGYESHGAEIVEVTPEGVARYIAVGRGGC